MGHDSEHASIETQIKKPHQKLRLKGGVLTTTFNAVVPFFEKYRILLTTYVSMEWGGSEQKGWHDDNPHGHISINSMFG